MGKHVVSNFSQSSTWCIVNVLKNGNTTTPNYCFFSSLYVKKDVHGLINIPCTKLVKKSSFSMVWNWRNSITTSESKTKEQEVPLSFRERFLNHLHIVRALDMVKKANGWYLSNGAPALSANQRPCKCGVSKKDCTSLNRAICSISWYRNGPFFTGRYFHKFHEKSSISWKYNRE